MALIIGSVIDLVSEEGLNAGDLKISSLRPKSVSPFSLVPQGSRLSFG